MRRSTFMVQVPIIYLLT